MKIFLAGSVSAASKKQLDKYDAYKKVILSCCQNANLTCPNDIERYRCECEKKNLKSEKREIDKLMVDYDLCKVRESDLVVCDLSEQSCGVGLELGVCKENGIETIFCFAKGSHISNMIYGAFHDSRFIEYETADDLENQLTRALKN